MRERLIAAGFNPSAKSFFSWLGVTYYLSAEAIDTMLSALSSICADGSTLVFDYPDENFFDAPEKRVQNTIMMAKAGSEPMQSVFSYSELETLLQKHGFLIYELLTPDDIQRDVIDKAGADMEKSKQFYHDVLGMEVAANFGANVTLTGGLVLQTLETWQSFIHRTFCCAGTVPGGNSGQNGYPA